MKKEIYVTQPSLPPLEEFIPYLERIWESKVLTNGGDFHKKLEEALCSYLGVKYISLFNNGTSALVTALQALNLKGEVITTPYSFVATANAIVWNNLKPVFVDVDKETLNIDPLKIEAAITERTSAILPVHCYGNPCDVDALENLASRYGLKVIYDAAHAFGVKKISGNSVLNYGDLSILSFHATKVFNTFEGGAIVSHDKATKDCIDQLKNFGFINESSLVHAGLNGKMSEVNAAFGMLQLSKVDKEIEKRRLISERYKTRLNKVNGINCVDFLVGWESNFSYFPILVEDNYRMSRDELHSKLKSNNINARKYFSPLISDFEFYRKECGSDYIQASCISRKILCLPIYSNLESDIQDKIINLIEF
ncbi:MULTISPECIES: DegT/DnrJ/EryC1/StrS family aminotransferase [Comamonas]|uniref:DegT/DnrJ/EryC1/StrS family aminotransferase n=1 Tax=Comamonas thiooxydans TaxID=363952 RepID=UPI0021149820|nr:DegT/DnrJ/EryC1/StrS family aminotransferase [Comamonas thiooxydans]UUE92270.1 DegT/DnrJ/EryC1/StrS family aminotransferase [Comamonas thiooxydans]